MEWMFEPYRRYFDFSGRSRRMEFWMFQLFIFLVYFVLGLLGGGLTGMSGDGSGVGIVGILVLLFLLGTIIPALAVQVRRFHDQDKSGLLVLLNLVPFIGPLIVLVMMFFEGTPGPNKYGPDPKGRDDVDLTAASAPDRPGGVNIR